ncbi:fatty acid desaturase 6 isoform X2 [Delphinapterus leucas]|uniref:Fatty acid desaturase 6 isoform X2 n=1 Tax=Delphinapterus leucas TaxID=9749 RepID=A0A2Y9PR88_DELLE|nr:fatty acid desaturase 6 isoform X2 [Delphinapterus leucas]
MVPQTRAGCGVRENARELFEIRQSGKALGGLPWGLCAPAPLPPGPLDRELLLAPDGLPTPAHLRARPAAILVLPAWRVAPGRVAAALGCRSPGARHAPLPGGGDPSRARDSAPARPGSRSALSPPGAADAPGLPSPPRAPSPPRGAHGTGAGRAPCEWRGRGTAGRAGGFLCLRSENLLAFALGVTILGVCHYTLTVKGSHLATHGALTESKRWSKIWVLFFVEVCTSFTAEHAKYGHVKMHHGYTNVLGLGDSSTWRLPCLNRYVYMFLAPLLIPIITPLVAVERLREVELGTALRTLGLISLGLYSHYWLLLNVSGFQSPSSALVCMLITRSLLAHPYLHVNIFQHIGLPMFSRDKKPQRIHMMSLGVLNLPRLPVLDWAFGHSLVSCHVEHHLFPRLSDNMCLKVFGEKELWFIPLCKGGLSQIRELQRRVLGRSPPFPSPAGNGR